MVPSQPLAVWIRGNERIELGDERGVAPGVEVGGDASVESGQAALLEPCSLRLGERLVGDVRQGRPPPEREGLRQRAVLDEPLEAVDIELAVVHTQEVARRTSDDAIGAERLPQRVHVHLQRALAARRRLLAPDPVDQAVHRHDLVRVEEEQRQESPRPGAAERHRHTVVTQDLERPQQPELHFLQRSLKPGLNGSKAVEPRLVASRPASPRRQM